MISDTPDGSWAEAIAIADRLLKVVTQRAKFVAMLRVLLTALAMLAGVALMRRRRYGARQ